MTSDCLPHQEVRLVLAGVTVAIALRKDTDGFLGVAFQPGPPGRNLQVRMPPSWTLMTTDDH
jgi:hypothetical protein